jgi:hypothetical protein
MTMAQCKRCGIPMHTGTKFALCANCRAEIAEEQFIGSLRDACGGDWFSIREASERLGVREMIITNRLYDAHQRGLLERTTTIRENGRRAALYRIFEPRGRRCAYPGCQTILSRYNRRTYCYTHERQAIEEGIYEGSYLWGEAC